MRLPSCAPCRKLASPVDASTALPDAHRPSGEQLGVERASWGGNTHPGGRHAEMDGKIKAVDPARPRL